MRVLIVGGGIGGLCAALALRRAGVRADVYERAERLREAGAGISLWPNATRLLHRLGLGPALEALGSVAAETVLRRSDGRILARTPAAELERRFGSTVVVYHRAELLEALAGALDPAQLHPGHHCVGLEQDEGGVDLRFAHGTTAHGDLLLGADGLHSTVRAWLGHRDPIRYAGYTAWRALVPFEQDRLLAGESWGRGARFGIVPVQGGRVYWFATASVPEGGTDPAAGAVIPLLERFAGWHEPIEALLRATDPRAILRNDIVDRDPLSAWGRGRITLLGDAAHPMTPNLGQGAGQAIEDALELAAAIASHDDPLAALRAYEARRIPRTGAIVLASRRLGRIGQLRSPLLRGLRDLALRLTPRALVLRNLAPVVGYEVPAAGDDGAGGGGSQRGAGPEP